MSNGSCGGGLRPPDQRSAKDWATSTDRQTATSADRKGADSRRCRQRLCDRSLDASEGGSLDQENYWSAVPSGARVENPNTETWMERAETHSASTRTQRAKSPRMDPRILGRGKKNAQKWHAWIVFLDESGLSQKPPVRRTRSPRGQTPVLRHAFNWKKLSICCALAYRWDGRKTRLLFSIVAGSYTDEKLISFLSEARKEFRHHRLIVVWDGLPSHRSRLMKQYLDAHQRRQTVVQLPSYAPDLNPVEFAWGNIQGKELTNLCCDDLGDMVSAVRKGFARICRDTNLPQSFRKRQNKGTPLLVTRKGVPLFWRLLKSGGSI